MIQSQNHETVPLDEWCGARMRARGPIAGKPGAWRNRPSRCSHGVERSVTRCWQCEPLGAGEKPRLPRSAQRCPRAYSLGDRTALLRALLDGPKQLAAVSEATGIRGEALSQLVRVLVRSKRVRLSQYSTLTLTARGRAVVGGAK